MYNNLTKLISILKFKKNQNSCYFIIKNSFNVDDFDIYEGGMLLFSDIPTSEKDYIFMNIIYKIKTINSEITINDSNEGLIKLKYKDLVSLLISNKIEAFYSDRNKIDSEIKNLINNYKRK